MVELWGRRMRLRTPWMVNWIMESVEVPSLSLLHLRVAPQQTDSMGKCLWISFSSFFHPSWAPTFLPCVFSGNSRLVVDPTLWENAICDGFGARIQDLQRSWDDSAWELSLDVRFSAGANVVVPKSKNPKKSNELIPKIAVVKGSYLFQTIVLGIYVSFWGCIFSNGMQHDNVIDLWYWEKIGDDWLWLVVIVYDWWW